MPTLGDYKVALSVKGFEGVNGSTPLVAAINAARRRVARARRWTFRELDSTSLTTAIGSSLVTVLPDWRLDAVRCRVSVADAWDLQYAEPEQIRSMIHSDEATGRPCYWSKRAGKILLYPIPDAAYTLVVDYVAGDVPNLSLDADADTALTSDVTLDAVAWAAAKELAFRMRDVNAVQMAEAEYQAAMLIAAREDATPQRQSGRQVPENPSRWESWNGR